jgi:hypothetical protein
LKPLNARQLDRARPAFLGRKVVILGFLFCPVVVLLDYFVIVVETTVPIHLWGAIAVPSLPDQALFPESSKLSCLLVLIPELLYSR